MRRILLVLLAAGVVLALAWALASLPGRVTAEIGDLSFEAATPVVALGLLLLFVVLYAVFRLLGVLIRLPRILRERQAARRRRAGDVAVTRTLLALAAAETGDARREASRARRLLGDTPATLLLTAEAGRIAGRTDETETRISRARQTATMPLFWACAACCGRRSSGKTGRRRRPWHDGPRRCSPARPGCGGSGRGWRSGPATGPTPSRWPTRTRPRRRSPLQRRRPRPNPRVRSA